MRQPSKQQERFAHWLESLADRKDRAVLAALRRGLSMGPAQRTWMLRYLPPGLGNERDEDAMCFVASLFAFHPLLWQKTDDRLWTNIGASLRMLAADEFERTGEMPSRIESRLEAVLQCHRDDLPEHLRRIVGLLKAQDVPVDWAQLLNDIARWAWVRRPVQREWARAFWRPGQGTDSDTKASEETPKETGEEAV